MSKEKAGTVTQDQDQSKNEPKEQTGPREWHKPEVVDLDIRETSLSAS